MRDLARSMIFPGCEVPFGGDASVARACQGAKLVKYAAKDGVALEGAFVRTGKADAPVVLFFHGNGESAAQNLTFARELKDEGIDTFLAEYRGYGGLTGSPSEEGLYLDGTAAIEAIYAAGVSREKVVLVGRSLGSGVAVELASKGHGSALILISPYTSMVDMGRSIAGPLAGLLVADKFENEKKIGTVGVPIVVIHGTKDEVIPYRMGERIAQKAKAKLVTLEGVGHNDIRNVGALVAGEIAGGRKK